MTTVRQMQIRGIRNFGAHDEDEQQIVFRSPLTIIVGENGCGKTTIIECLKYAVTGEFPPNTGNGGQFVHDLKLAGANHVLGQVKLQIMNKIGDKITINRLVKKEKKGATGKEAVTNIDATVTYLNAKTKETKQHTRRIGDATVEMCELMGVSKAILNYVIFCHQEDSCWPFESAKELKEKFDAIFGTTQYIKVVEKLIKERKERQVALKIAAEQEISARGIKDEVQFKKDKLSGYEVNLEKLKVEQSKIDEKIQPIQERLDRIIEIEMQYAKLHTKYSELKTKIKSLEERAQTSRNKITNPFTGDVLDLKRKIREFEHSFEETKRQRERAERELKALQETGAAIQQKLKQIEVTSAKIKIEIQHEQDTSANRAELVQNLGIQLGFDSATMDNLENDNEQVERLIAQMTGRIQQEEDKVTVLSGKHEATDTAMQKQIDDLQRQQTTIETEIKGKQGNRASMSKERSELHSQINFIESSQAQMNDIIAEIANLDENLSKLKETARIDEARETLNGVKSQRETLEKEDDLLNDQINSLSSVAQILTEVGIKEEDLKKSESSYKLLVNKHTGNMTRILGKTLDRNFKAEIDRKVRTLDTEVKEMKDRISKHDTRIVELKTIRKTQRDRLSTLETELKRAQNEIYETCGDDDFEELLEKRKEKYMKAQLEFGAIKSAEALYKKYINEIKDHPSCPLCHTDMHDDGRELLSNELSDKINQLPHEIAGQERQLKIEERAYNRIMSLRSVNDQISRFKTDISTIEEDSKKKELDIKKIQSELDDMEIEVSDPTSKLSLATSMVSDFSQLDNFRSAIDKLSQEVAKLRSKLPENYSPNDLAGMKARRQVVQRELREIRGTIEKAEKSIERNTDRLNRLQDGRNKLIEQKMKMQDNLNNLPEKKARHEQLKKDIVTLDHEIADLQARIKTITRDLQAKVTEKDSVKQKNRQTLQIAQSRLNEIQDKQKDIQRDTLKLREFKNRSLSEKLRRLTKDHAKERRDEDENADQRTEIATKLDNLKTAIANQDSIRRDLDENLDLMEIEERLVDEKRELQKIEKDAGELDYDKFKAEKKKLMDEREKLENMGNTTRGRAHQIDIQIKDARTELELPRNKEAFEKWVEKMKRVTVIEMMIGDLEQSRKAIEFSLAKFHQEKMAQINQYIRALWREIYRGNDIDYIEIRAEEPSVSDGSKIRRYDYRVMQCKNTKEMDMRGRCSAGQKVLASLIIRMALSETFSANCGVMTLDEPTTNLDQQNIASLCEAISRILNDRGRYGNLLLIIITHDEKFLQTLSPYLESAYRVSRNREGKSVITRV